MSIILIKISLDLKYIEAFFTSGIGDVFYWIFVINKNSQELIGPLRSFTSEQSSSGYCLLCLCDSVHLQSFTYMYEIPPAVFFRSPVEARRLQRKYCLFIIVFSLLDNRKHSMSMLILVLEFKFAWA